MSSIKNISQSNTVPIDLAKHLGVEGINIILNMLWLAYHDLKSEGIIQEKDGENKITQEWGARLTHRWYKDNRASRICIRLVPQNQYEDDTMARSKRKSPAIDFCFRAWNSNEGYFGAECKNLYKKRLDKKKRYVETGVNHFVSGYYASKSTVSAMVGYVLSGDIPDVVNCLTPLIGRTNPIQNLTRDMLVEDPQYKTLHMRTCDGEEIRLHHLFFNFVA